MGMIEKLFGNADDEVIQKAIDEASEELQNFCENMKHFVVRVDFNPNFVLKVESIDGMERSPKTCLCEILKQQDYFNSMCADAYRSFTAFSMMASSALQCEERVLELWKELYPDNINAIQVLAYPDNDTETAKVVKEIYCNYIGWDKYCELITDMAYEKDFVNAHDLLKIVMSQNFLVSMDSGCGFSTMVSSFSDYLTRTGYFVEPANCFHECVINEDVSMGETTTETLLGLLMNDDSQGKQDLKEQCIGIDISYFLDEQRHDELRRFLKHLHKLQSKYVFVFRIPYLEDKSRRKIYEIMEDLVHVKELVVEPYSELVYEELFVETITKCQLSCQEDALKVFRERMQLERRDGRFYGFKTVEKLANEAVLLKTKFTARATKNGRDCDLTTICAADIQDMVKGYAITDRSGYDELHELIGMEEIEERIKEIVTQVKLAKSSEGIEMPSLHMRFTGAPGTGKTTVARILGKIFKEEGILRKGNFFEYAARSLCGEYLGQTAPRTAQICRDAYGSVLFLDEAYALNMGESASGAKDYGHEVISTLIAEMENHRDDMVVIMAGYTDDMDKLMEMNSGLRSRMPFVIEFKSYSREQLAAIFMNYVRKHFSVGEGLEAAVQTYFNELPDSYIQSKEFANARYVRNLYERTWAKAAQRISGNGMSDVKITVDDFNAAKSEKEFSEKIQITKTIGFTMGN